MVVVDTKKIEKVISRSPSVPASLITVLQDIQREFHYLPEESLKLTSDKLGVPLSKVYSAATFYKAFSLVPRGRKIIRVCKGTACHIKGADLILEQLELGIGLKPGQTSENLEYTVEVVNCVGACALAPVMIVNDKYHANVRGDKAVKLAEKD